MLAHHNSRAVRKARLRTQFKYTGESRVKKDQSTAENSLRAIKSGSSSDFGSLKNRTNPEMKSFASGVERSGSPYPKAIIRSKLIANSDVLSSDNARNSPSETETMRPRRDAANAGKVKEQANKDLSSRHFRNIKTASSRLQSNVNRLPNFVLEIASRIRRGEKSIALRRAFQSANQVQA